MDGIKQATEIKFSDAPSRARRKAVSGDVIVSTVRTYLKAVAAVTDEYADCVFSTGFAVLRARKLDQSFLKWAILSELLVQAIEAHSEGLSYPAINASTLAKLKVAVPPPEEQSLIAKVLDQETARIDTLIAKKTRFIELLKEKRQAVITKAVTKGLDDSVKMKDSGVEWLGSVPYHWKVVPLKHLLEGALQYGATESGETFIEEWPRYIRITDIDSHGRLRSEGAKSLAPSIAEPYLIKKWDILFARSGATVGKSFVYEGEDYKACFAGYMIRASVNPSLICSEYLYFYLQSHSYWEYIVGSQSQATIQNVSAEKYGALFVPLPPIEEQSNLLTFLKKTTSRVDELISRTERSIELLKEKRSALITAAVTGKIDVREAA
jgi:type I restriction enzyme S subunit